LINRIKSNTFSTELPQRLEELTVSTKVDGKEYQVTISDTLASDDRSRRLAYMDTNVFLICFAFNSPDSLKQVPTWVKDLTITHQCDVPTPYFLVGTCSDLQPHQVPDADVKAMKEKHADKITEHFDVSSKDGEGIQALWDAVSKAAVKNNSANAPAPAQKQNGKQPANQNPVPKKKDPNGKGCEIF